MQYDCIRKGIDQLALGWSTNFDVYDYADIFYPHIHADASQAV